ncbi:response regulator transcription factor [Glaciecola sp. KUL10]|jgi:two-component system response regulator CpxR|uniref:response regulator transcription factor n=1 Tax=Glaciecola sp. (strain KUL10) TaxID=2161813 RepID=UPI000D78A7CA|nr:response regulator transcription factor [Glaciecola sp. KUL10]GBL03783.1 transcriptional regulatory protein CpxR [Glaciecola sp. KUL10]
MNTVLIIDDDKELGQVLCEYLEQNDLKPNVVNQPSEALEHLKTNDYDLILLDVMMPEIDGFEVLRRLRQHNQTPVIMLTAKGDAYDKVLGLELGADDYLAKPFNHRELLARIKANTRRFSENGRITKQTSLTLMGVRVNSATQSTHVNEQLVELTSTEFQLLSLLMRNAGEMLTKEQLSQSALGKRLSPHDRSLDMHISNVRKKLSQAGASNLIKTIRGSGYLFMSEQCI